MKQTRCFILSLGIYIVSGGLPGLVAAAPAAVNTRLIAPEYKYDQIVFPTFTVNPSLAGTCAQTSFSYAPGSSSASDSLRTDLAEYFAHGDSDLASSIYAQGYRVNKLPIEAVAARPSGSCQGPFPLVLVIHGNASSNYESHKGFSYLTNHLASHGFIASSLAMRFLNDTDGEVMARAVLVLRHLQKFRAWNADPGHALYQKIDMTRIALIGHSRGGEAAAVAYQINSLMHNPSVAKTNYGFNIRAVMGLAPTDAAVLGIACFGASDDPFVTPPINDDGCAANPNPQYQLAWGPVVLRGVDYLVLQGSHDGDMKTFDGQMTYDRALPLQENTTHFKAMAFIHGANHKKFNDWWHLYCVYLGDCESTVTNTYDHISVSTQQNIAKTYAVAFLRQSLFGNNYSGVFLNGSYLPSDVRIVKQYQVADRDVVADYESGSRTSIQYPLATGVGGGLDIFERDWFHTTTADPYTYGYNNGLVIAWSAASDYYDVRFNRSYPAPANGNQYLVLNVGQVYESWPQYNTNTHKEFSIQLKMVNGTWSNIVPVSAYQTLRPPIRTTQGGVDYSKSIMTTVRIPLSVFAPSSAWNWSQVDRIRLRFDQSPTGKIILDNIYFSN